MKDLKDIINEAIVKGKLKSYNKNKKIDVYFPRFKEVKNGDYKFIKFDKLSIPEGPFYIYKDKYRNKLHITSYNDMAASIGQLYADFEDFSAEDIIAGFKTLKEAVEYSIKDGYYDGTTYKSCKYYDHKDFIESVMNDEFTDEEYIDDVEEYMEIGVSFADTVDAGFSMAFNCVNDEYYRDKLDDLPIENEIKG